MTSTTSGCTRSPGSVPALIAFAFAGSARRLNQAAAICDRPALWTQANRTVFTNRPSDAVALPTWSAARSAARAVEYVQLSERPLKLFAVASGGRQFLQRLDRRVHDFLDRRRE